MYVCVPSGFSHVRLFAPLWTRAPQALCVEFPRQEYWNGLPFPFSGDLHTQESNQSLLHCRHILPTEPPGKSYIIYTCGLKIIIQRYKRIYRNTEISVFAQIVLIHGLYLLPETLYPYMSIYPLTFFLIQMVADWVFRYLWL